MIFTYQNCEKKKLEKKKSIQLRPRIFKNFEITKVIFFNSEESEKKNYERILF